MATVLPAQAALNAKLNRSRPTQKERKLIRQQAATLHQHDHQEQQEQAHDVLQAIAEPEKGDALEWLALTDKSRYRTVPALFTPDAAYCFLASGAAVRIYSVLTTELVSTLSIPPSPSSSSSGGLLARATVTALLLSPSNPRQLVVASSDGKLRLWDYVEGRLVRTLEMGAPVVHATASDKLPDQVFVALAAPGDSTVEKGKAAAAEEGENVLAGVYVVSLRAARSTAAPTSTSTSTTPAAASSSSSPSIPVLPARRVRLAVPRPIRSLSLSPSGSILASLTPSHVHLCLTSQLNKGFTKSVEAPMAREGGERMTSLAFHPTENVFATGNEKGQIRVWYNVLPRPASSSGDDDEAMQEGEGEGGAATTTSTLHWHAHAVTSLAFTPNGAYLLSGGREAVLVLWQLHSGHQEYVPRLGAEIETITVLDSNAENGEQQVVMRLADGSTVFVGSQRLKVGKSIAGLKADLSSSASNSSRALLPASTRSSSSGEAAPPPLPLAFDPSTSSLVLPSGHPSTLQFYHPSSDTLTLELEISPSNRVASANGRVEPTRVERVAFSKPAGGKGEEGTGTYWMATVDSWTREGFASVRQLKFWRKREGGQPGFVLSTRIDRPHDAPITSLAFSPSSASPLLLTTSTDGQIKLWGPSSSSSSSSDSGAWQCRASLAYRSLAPVASSWSHDGSLFAIAHAKRTVTLWSTANAGQLVHAFSATAVGKLKSVCFADKEGTKVVCAGSAGAVCWDLLTLEETFSTSIEFAALVPKPRSSALIGVEDVAPSTSTSNDNSTPAALLYVFDPSAPASAARKPKTRPLPHPVRQALWLPSLLSTSDNDEEDVSLAVTATDATGSVALVGKAARSSVAAGAGAAARLPIATEGTTRLFDEIFGDADLASSRKTTSSSSTSTSRPSKAGAAGGGILGSTDGEGAPAHTLPPVRMLWREVFRDAFAVPAQRPAPAAAAAANDAAAGGASEQHEKSTVSAEAPSTSTWTLGDTEAVRRIFSARLGL
ncbi:hypothetical protein JCM10908_002273 [Rhodotorula pacifica]|uniref:WD40 repeat domain-containing protein n=1 Tax=Rhodotorula pacifica TaxID=1495444 RepID=UPI00316D2F3B